MFRQRWLCGWSSYGSWETFQNLGPELVTMTRFVWLACVCVCVCLWCVCELWLSVSVGYEIIHSILWNESVRYAAVQPQFCVKTSGSTGHIMVRVWHVSLYWLRHWNDFYNHPIMCTQESKSTPVMAKIYATIGRKVSQQDLEDFRREAEIMVSSSWHDNNLMMRVSLLYPVISYVVRWRV